MSSLYLILPHWKRFSPLNHGCSSAGQSLVTGGRQGRLARCGCWFSGGVINHLKPISRRGDGDALETNRLRLVKGLISRLLGYERGVGWSRVRTDVGSFVTNGLTFVGTPGYVLCFLLAALWYLSRLSLECRALYPHGKLATKTPWPPCGRWFAPPSSLRALPNILQLFWLLLYG